MHPGAALPPRAEVVVRSRRGSRAGNPVWSAEGGLDHQSDSSDLLRESKVRAAGRERLVGRQVDEANRRGFRQMEQRKVESLVA